MSRVSTKFGLRLLSLDGGGVSVLSTLVIIRELMCRIQVERRLSDIPRPCDLFHLIAGTGTGGLVAILLGRLEMTIDQTIECYMETLRRVFSPKKVLARHAVFSAAELEKTMGEIVTNRCGKSNERMIASESSSNACKVAVYAVTADAIRAGITTCIRTYRVPGNQGPDCTIVEAVRATTATPKMFKRMVIAEHGIKIPYVGGGLGCNNATSQLLLEAGLALPDQPLACLVSVGAGQLRSTNLPAPRLRDRFLPSTLVAVVEAIATDCEKMHQETSIRFSDTKDVYIRFNTEQGMQDIDQSDATKLSDVQSHTRVYLQDASVNSRMKAAVRNITIGRGELELRAGANLVLLYSKHLPACHCPSPSPAFTGREEILGLLQTYFFEKSKGQRVFVLYGLGGAGKTQLALMFADRYRDLCAGSEILHNTAANTVFEISFWDVFYLDATSGETSVAGLKQLANAVKCGETAEDALSWLISVQERWLVVFNNADDPVLDLHDYFSDCQHGNILITTRNQNMLVHAEGSNSDCRVSEMDPNEALTLLLKTSGSGDSEDATTAAVTLIKYLGYFALAIVQAGAYVRAKQCGLSRYLELYLTSRDQLLRECYTGQTGGYKLGVYATWELSFRQLNLQASQLLCMLSFVHHEGIKEQFFEIASARIKTFEPMIPLSAEESTNRIAAVEFLATLRSSSDVWNPFAFQQLVDELSSFSLLAYDPAARTYSMHPLVQSWCRARASEFPACDCMIWVLGLCVRWEFASEDLAFRRLLLPHLVSLHEGRTQAVPDLVILLARVYQEAGYQKEDEALCEYALQASLARLGAGHPCSLARMHNLAYTYLEQGRWGEASANLVKLVKLRTRSLGPEHEETLASLHNLAFSYAKQERWREAETLYMETLETKTRVLGPEHHETLKSMRNLALTYNAQGKWQEGEELLIEASDHLRRVLGNEHPTTLVCFSDLASMHRSQGRLPEAEKLQVDVLDAMKKVQSARHPNTLGSMHGLAMIYERQNKTHEAVVLMGETVRLRKQVLGEQHPDSQASIRSLADIQSHARDNGSGAGI